MKSTNEGNGGSTFVNRSDLERIVEIETRRRNKSVIGF